MMRTVIHAGESERARRAGPERSSGTGAVVADIMTREVTAVSPETPLDEATRLLLRQTLPGLAVVDSDRRVIGVLGEHDLLGRLAPRRLRPWWHVLVDAEHLAREYRKAVGGTAGEVMTYPAPTVGATAGLEVVTRLLKTDLDLVPVVASERLIGAVCRRHLVGALAPTRRVPIVRADANLLAQMESMMARETWVSKPRPTVDAHEGVLALWGIVGGEAEKAALVTMARSIPGCQAVDDHLIARDPAYRYHEMV